MDLNKIWDSVDYERGDWILEVIGNIFCIFYRIYVQSIIVD